MISIQLCCSVLLAFQALHKVSSFTPNLQPNSKTASRKCLELNSFFMDEASSPNASSSTTTSVDIVLFGIGDLRTTDNGGLAAALASKTNGNANNKVLPLLILDTQDTLPNVPMARSHTYDTAALVSAGIQSLESQLAKLNLKLHVKHQIGARNSVDELMNQVLQEVKMEVPNVDDITVHACDLGEVDNRLGYSPLPHLERMEEKDFTLKAWNCHLRQDTWQDVVDNPELFPSTFVDFKKKYTKSAKGAAGGDYPTLAKSDQSNPDNEDTDLLTLDLMTAIPSQDEIENLLCIALKYDLNDKDVKQKLEQDRNTGLYATHWGGLNVAETFHEDRVLEATDIFLGQNAKEEEGDEALVQELKWWSKDSTESKLVRNELSLEHASINWMMTGGDSESVDSNSVKTSSLIEGELLTRYLAAPLLYGLISPRYVWNKADEAANAKKNSFFDTLVPSLLKSRKTIEVMKTVVESREWHKLFAYKSILASDDDGFDVGYWRWHGFLCRYVMSVSNKSEGTDASVSKEGIALIHGFGASGSQWKKSIIELQKGMTDDLEVEALAPDLIGFGQSEKPSLTYTQYLWESYSSSFVKEVALGKQKWSSFTIGGNSIGGYTAMSAAADDTVVNTMGGSGANCVTASGANGSTKCKGLVLMNSAGKVFKKEEITTNPNGATIAEATSNDLLGKCSPPPRQIASIGGTGLLSYLRPRIQEICVNLYPTNGAAVDDILCSGILRDSLDPGAINVMISGSKLPPPRTANELLGADFGSSKSRPSAFDSRYSEGTFDGPVLIAQGFLDPLNDAKGRAEMFGNLRNGIKVDEINAGHCPHDELPADIAKSISSWLTSDVKRPSNASSSPTMTY